MRRALRVLIAASLLLTVVLGAAGGVAADVNDQRVECRSVDLNDETVSESVECQSDGVVTIDCGSGGDDDDDGSGGSC